ncbi:hypothetical protein MIMGU_mgv1a016799mg [Erythranthe guttata]|uniref:Uncharacterized protein n=1 Tax=Erythranthe guttata TaxID=4155 RepID=A0A022Q5Y2_ERYGU|nr:hypothetical protein MIMGU_mgv1a016799mg [Erythranthe guttata]
MYHLSPHAPLLFFLPDLSHKYILGFSARVFDGGTCVTPRVPILEFDPSSLEDVGVRLVFSIFSNFEKTERSNLSRPSILESTSCFPSVASLSALSFCSIFDFATER